MKNLMEPCKHCDHASFCREHGCTAWNDEARRLWDGWEKIHADQMKRRGLKPRRNEDEWIFGYDL